MLSTTAKLYHDAGLTLLNLYSMKGNQCECGDPECQGLGKHPKLNGWQNTLGTTAAYEQIVTYERYNMDQTGYGWVLDSCHLVVDIDPKNGGDISFKKLCEKIPELEQCNITVRTGGGGSHLYYKKPADLRIIGKMDKLGYPGIDLKTKGGFVVAAGSLHKSGDHYELNGYCDDDLTEMDDAPQALLDLIERKTAGGHSRTSYEGVELDIEEVVRHIPNNDLEYDDWIAIGMAIHYETSGTGYAIWDQWSQSSDKYDPAQMDHKWHSFGKCSDPVTAGTLVHTAMANGYKPHLPVEEAPEWLSKSQTGVDKPEPVAETIEQDAEEDGIPDPDTSGCNILKPPGIVGDMVNYINENCIRSRPYIAVGAALWSIGSIMSKMYVGPRGVRPNIIALCLANSATGKDQPLQIAKSAMIEAGVGAAVYSGMASAQDITRSLLEHEMTFYAADEVHGILKAGSDPKAPSYLKQINDTILNAATEKVLLMRGNDKRQFQKDIEQRLQQLYNRLDDCENDNVENLIRKKIKRTELKEDYLKRGLKNPFFSMFGVSTPHSMDGVISAGNVASGLIGRTIIFREFEELPDPRFYGIDVPRVKSSISDDLAFRIRNISNKGRINDKTQEYGGEVGLEFFGDPVQIGSTPEAAEYLKEVHYWLEHKKHDLAIDSMASIYLRAFEMVIKIATVLAAETCEVSLDMAKWAFALVKKDINHKAGLMIVAEGNDQDSTTDDKIQSLYAKIIELCNCDGGRPPSTIYQRCKKYARGDIDQAIQKLINLDRLQEISTPAKGARGRASKRYVTTKGDFVA